MTQLVQSVEEPVQPVEEPVDQLCLSGRVPVEGSQKVFLSPSGLLFPVEVILFPVKVILFPVEVRSRTGRGLVEAQRSPTKHLMLTASQSVDP